jgi:hypothetical protein
MKGISLDSEEKWFYISSDAFLQFFLGIRNGSSKNKSENKYYTYNTKYNRERSVWAIEIRR